MVNHLPKCFCLSGPQRQAWGWPRCQRMWLLVRRNVECGLTAELEIASGLVIRSETLTHSPANHSARLKTFIFFNCIEGKVHKHPSSRTSTLSHIWWMTVSAQGQTGRRFFLMVLKHCANQQSQNVTYSSSLRLALLLVAGFQKSTHYLLEYVVTSRTSRWLTATPGMPQSRNLAMQNKTKHDGKREWKTSTDS